MKMIGQLEMASPDEMYHGVQILIEMITANK